MLKQNEAEFERCNIPTWHQQGYTGKGIKIAELEGANVNAPFFEGKLHNPFNMRYDKHGEQVLDVVHQITPDAELYCLPVGRRIIGGKVSGSFVEQSLPYAIAEGIDLITASFDGTDNTAFNEVILQAQEKGIIFVASIGNYEVDSFAKSEAWISVGAVGLDNNKVTLKNYSVQHKCIDFLSFSGLYVHEGQDVAKVEGTSFSQPVLSGMIALVQQFFFEKTRRKLTQQQMYRFLQDHSADMGADGHDTAYGHGLVVLPNPQDIDVSKYIEVSNMADFPDIQGHWAEAVIKEVAKLGLMKGCDGGLFKPNETVTRAELAAAILQIYKEIKMKGEMHK